MTEIRTGSQLNWPIAFDPLVGDGQPVLYFIAETEEPPHLGTLRTHGRLDVGALQITGKTRVGRARKSG
jgi:hypothetical protein